jgi:hypothetical protein
MKEELKYRRRIGYRERKGCIDGETESFSAVDALSKSKRD